MGKKRRPLDWPITDDIVAARLRQWFGGGPLDSLPRGEDDLLLLLALAALIIPPDDELSEPGVNTILADWLPGFCRQPGIDHVTLRRALVDHGFLVRDDAGTRYHVAPARVRACLGDIASHDGNDPALVLAASERERAERRAQHQRNRG